MCPTSLSPQFRFQAWLRQTLIWANFNRGGELKLGKVYKFFSGGKAVVNSVFCD